MDAIFRLVDELLLPGGNCTEFSFAPMASEVSFPDVDACYRLDENPAGLMAVHLVCTGQKMQLSFNDGGSLQTITAVIGSWTLNSFMAKHMIPTLHALLPTERPEPIRAAACAAVENGKLVLCLRYKSNPHTEWYDIRADENTLRINIRSNADALRPAGMRTFIGRK